METMSHSILGLRPPPDTGPAAVDCEFLSGPIGAQTVPYLTAYASAGAQGSAKTKPQIGPSTLDVDHTSNLSAEIGPTDVFDEIETSEAFSLTSEYKLKAHETLTPHGPINSDERIEFSE